MYKLKYIYKDDSFNYGKSINPNNIKSLLQDEISFHSNCKRIDLIDLTTNEVIDSIDDSKYISDKVYHFKFYYEDGKEHISTVACANPEDLYIDFDGFLDWDDYYDLKNKNLSTGDILHMAIKFYKNAKRIEIINVKTNEIVDYIEK